MRPNILGAEAIEWLGVHYKTILRQEETGGTMSVVDSVSPPNSGPPRHIHHDADETFVILSGDILFWLEGDEFTRGPGQTMFVPRGKQHTFRVVSDAPARHLVILTPGGFEGFFAEMADNNYRIPEDMPAIADCAARYQLSFTGPAL
ncbi:cupin domain-containing protein [Hoeflea sp. EC-HK425]|uniref:cupin domain-containing protein n=1 Tax=Hoeflea sp. EC-HK425 TaxID=2038388 RepID=UPI00125217A7|nr:cupin domain-containing protein [Hoeflea sp. EC-HK425]VVT11846.1 Cupin [Hoeflea sp. EC-HK425]